MKKYWSQAMRLCAGYILFGGLWILFSDRALFSLVHDPLLLTELQTYKGWLFVAYSALLILTMTSGRLRRNDRILREVSAREETARTIFDGVTEAVFLFDPKTGSLGQANPAMLKLFDYGAGDILRLELSDLCADVRQGEESSVLSWVGGILKQPPAHFDWQVKDSAGRVFWVEAIFRPVELPEGPRVLAVARDIDERKALETLTKERQRELGLLSDSLPGPVSHVDRQGRYRFVNRSFERWFGVASETVLGRTMDEVLGPQVYEEVRPYEERVLAGARVAYEKMVRKTGGETVPVLVTLVPDKNARSGVEGYFTILTDISAIKVVEEQLAESEGRYESLFRNNHVVMLLVEPAGGRIVDANPAACAFYGYELNQMQGMPISRIDVLDESEIRKNRRMAADNEQNRFEFRHRLAGGELRDVEVFSGPIRVQGRELLYSIINDITARKQAQARVQLFAAAFASSQDAVVITDLTPVILAVNPAFESITGYREEEVLGRNPNILKSGRQDGAFFETMWKTLRETGFWQGEIWNRRKDGEIFPEWLSLSTVYDEQGAPSRYVAVSTDLTRLRQSEEQRDRLLHYDPLTALPNRLLVQARLEHSVQRAKRAKRHLGVLMMDVDDFMVINDSLGNAMGDELLCMISKRLGARLRAEDTLGRMGADTFAAVFEDLASPADAAEIVEELRASIAEPFVLPGAEEVFVHMSIGLSLFPQDGESAQQLLGAAGVAMNKARERGGDHCEIYSPALLDSARSSLELHGRLRRALELREFSLYYQPKVQLATGRICGAEALVRWRTPDGGLIPPLQFIPAAERSGLIIPLGAWILEEACRQSRAWQDEGLAPLPLAVNVSARQFRSRELESVLAGALERYGLQPSLLMVELTESLLMDDPDDGIARMLRLKELGVGLSLDDFGTGYSSLSRLAQFPIDQLKIDRSFVSGVVTDPGCATIVNSVIALAHRMRLKVVAEGVEDAAQLGYLHRLHCDEIQGYYFSRPVPAGELAEMLRRGKTLVRESHQEEGHRTLLLVDDEPHILSSLRRLFDREGYRVFTAPGPHEALRLLATHEVQVIVSDQRMPEMCGTEFLSRVKTLHPETVRLILSGYADLEVVTRSVNEGALYKFLVKPWKDEALLAEVRDAFLYQESHLKGRFHEAARSALGKP